MDHPHVYLNSLLESAEEIAGSKSELARDLKVSKSMLTMLSSGDRVPSFALLTQLFDYVEISGISGRKQAVKALRG